MDGWRNNRPFTGVKYIGIGALRPGRGGWGWVSSPGSAMK